MGARPRPPGGRRRGRRVLPAQPGRDRLPGPAGHPRPSRPPAGLACRRGRRGHDRGALRGGLGLPVAARARGGTPGRGAARRGHPAQAALGGDVPRTAPGPARPGLAVAAVDHAGRRRRRGGRRRPAGRRPGDRRNRDRRGAAGGRLAGGPGGPPRRGGGPRPASGPAAGGPAAPATAVALPVAGWLVAEAALLRILVRPLPAEGADVPIDEAQRTWTAHLSVAAASVLTL